MYPRRIKGFTLIELLIAIAIFALIAAAAYAGLDTVLKAAEHTRIKTQALDRLQRAQLQLGTDIEQLILRPIRDDLGDELEALSYTELPLQFEFTRAGWDNPAGQLRSGLQRVAYMVEDESLYRDYWFDLDRMQGSRKTRRLLLEDVESMQLRFMDTKSEWQDQWPPSTGGNDSLLPLAVEVNITLVGWGELTWLYALPG